MNLSELLGGYKFSKEIPGLEEVQQKILNLTNAYIDATIRELESIEPKKATKKQ